MTKRNIQIPFRLNKKEAQQLQKNVKKSGLYREAYLRHLINGFVPQEAPPADYYAMMGQLYGIGKNLNQIAHKAHAIHDIDAQRYDEEIRHFRQVVKEITEAVMLPKPFSPAKSCTDFCGEEWPRSGESFADQQKR